MNESITQSRLKELFVYKDGNLIRKVASSNRVKVGDIAGTLRADGYTRIRVDVDLYFLHRLIFLMHHGYLPKEIDHIDGNPSNNNIYNLRKCTRRENQHNSKMRKDNTSGTKGVYWNKTAKKWQAQINIEGKCKYLGLFDNLLDADCKVISARNKLHGEFACHGQLKTGNLK